MSKTKSKSTIDILQYRNDPLHTRNHEIWRLRFNEYWTLKEIGKYFDLEIVEVKKIIARHKNYYEQIYG